MDPEDKAMSARGWSRPWRPGARTERRPRARCHADALNRRALRFAYVVDEPLAGGVCSGCGVLALSSAEPCDFCGSSRSPVRDLVGRMAAAVAESGGRLDRLHGSAAERLRGAGGVGAFLRF
jgi:hypothetical protein